MALTRIEEGTSQGLVVAKVDRFGRSLLDGLLAIKRIEDAGGSFFSVLDGLDLTTDTGRLVLRIMLSMAEWEFDRIRTQWDVARSRAVARGTHPAGSVPPGYRKTRAGRLQLEPTVAPLVAQAFRMRADGASLQAVGRFLEGCGIRTGAGNVGWSTRATRRALATEAYLGVIRCGPHRNDHAHPPLVPRATWLAAQRPGRPMAPKSASNALLAGMVRCANCGFTMSPGRRFVAGREVHYYACRSRHATGTCPAPANIASFRLDPCVVPLVFELLRRRRRPPRELLHDVEQRALEAQDALAHYRDSDRVLRALGERAFAQGLTRRVERAVAAQNELAVARDRLAAHSVPSYLETRQQWQALDVEERRTVIRSVIDLVFVKPNYRVPLDERIMVCPTGKAPARLPHQGAKHAPLRSFEMRRGWLTPAAG
jgi:hypothetical protein